MPEVLFRGLMGKSRDELEQEFIRQEQNLDPSEYKSYVYAAFDLQQFFSGFLAKGMPQAMDQEKVDACFLEELCRLNRLLFTPGQVSGLDDYLVRYAVMFFDHEYAHSTVLDEFARDFMSRHRQFQPPLRSMSLPLDDAVEMLGLTRDEFEALDRGGLIRHYRKTARRLHPDTGGDHDTFIRMTEAFQGLLGRKT
jgi:hypothetical protein